MKSCIECNHPFSSPAWTCPACGHEPQYLNGVVAHAPDLAKAGGGFKPEYFATLAQLEATNFWFRARNELIIWALRTYQPQAESLLEVGCGTGFVLSGIAATCPEIHLQGSEIFIDGLAQAAARLPDAQFMQMDARQIPYVDEFDAIGAFDVLEHIEEDEKVLAQLHRALKPGGILLLTVPQHPWLWSATDDYACHVRRYTNDELTRKLLAQDFTIERNTSFVSVLLPAMLLSRRKKTDSTAEHDMLAELRLPKLINESLYTAMRAEQALIKCGVNLPLGGSRLAVARKKNKETA
ncbi:MAG TPA: methyltransferase domain-containing protein [Alcaligenes sp.]|nr:methyltransferase domain-containing protein [Alcaligenes sp.]